MKKIILINLLFLSFSISSFCQLSDKDLQSDEVLSFFKYMIQNENIVIGEIRKIDEQWDITADNKETTNIFICTDQTYKIVESDLKLGLSTLTNYITNSNQTCYTYKITKEKGIFKLNLNMCP